MGRITITLSDRDHLAFKLLALQQQKKLVSLIQEAISDYLQRTGAYDLCIRRNSSDQNLDP